MTEAEAIQLVREFATASQIELDPGPIARVLVKNPSLESAFRSSLKSHALRTAAEEHAQQLAESRPEFERAVNQSISRMRALA
jgi:hypothetical protein